MKKLLKQVHFTFWLMGRSKDLYGPDLARRPYFSHTYFRWLMFKTHWLCYFLYLAYQSTELAAFSSTPVSHLHILDIPESALKSGISFRRISYLPSARTRGKHSRRKLVAHSTEVEDDIISSPHLGNIH